MKLLISCLLIISTLKILWILPLNILIKPIEFLISNCLQNTFLKVKLELCIFFLSLLKRLEDTEGLRQASLRSEDHLVDSGIYSALQHRFIRLDPDQDRQIAELQLNVRIL